MKKMMIVLMAILTAVLMVALVGCSGGSNPEKQLAQVEALIEKDYPMNEEQARQVKEFVAEGKRLLTAGKTEESAAAFANALEILKLAENAFVYGKAE